MILDTNSDLNLYKEMWQNEKVNESDPTSSCCDMTRSRMVGEMKMADVDFNLWTGEFTHKLSSEQCGANHIHVGLFPLGSFKIFAIKPNIHG